MKQLILSLIAFLSFTSCESPFSRSTPPSTTVPVELQEPKLEPLVIVSQVKIDKGDIFILKDTITGQRYMLVSGAHYDVAVIPMIPIRQ